MIDNRELEIALMESARNKASDDYFNARKELWSKRKQKVFDDGFERAWYLCRKEQDQYALLRKCD